MGFFGFPSLGLISNGGMGLIKFFWVFGGLIDNSGVGLISFLWVSMGLGFFGDGGGVCYFGMGLIGGVVLLMADLGQGW